MTNLQLIERLCQLLDIAQEIIREQAALLEMHGIIPDDGGALDRQRTQLLSEIEERI